MPAVDQVELGRDLVAGGLRRTVFNVLAWVEMPVGVGVVKVKDRANVVHQDDVDIEATGDQASGLEEIVVPLVQSLFAVAIDSLLARCETTILVDCE